MTTVALIYLSIGLLVLIWILNDPMTDEGGESADWLSWAWASVAIVLLWLPIGIVGTYHIARSRWFNK